MLKKEIGTFVSCIYIYNKYQSSGHGFAVCITRNKRQKARFSFCNPPGGRTEEMSQQIPEAVIPYGTKVSRFWVWKENTGRRHQETTSSPGELMAGRSACTIAIREPSAPPRRAPGSGTPGSIALLPPIAPARTHDWARLRRWRPVSSQFGCG
jgi:hypothetical protein